MDYPEADRPIQLFSSFGPYGSRKALLSMGNSVIVTKESDVLVKECLKFLNKESNQCGIKMNLLCQICKCTRNMLGDHYMTMLMLLSRANQRLEESTSASDRRIISALTVCLYSIVNELKEEVNTYFTSTAMVLRDLNSLKYVLAEICNNIIRPTVTEMQASFLSSCVATWLSDVQYSKMKYILNKQSDKSSYFIFTNDPAGAVSNSEGKQYRICRHNDCIIDGELMHSSILRSVFEDKRISCKAIMLFSIVDVEGGVTANIIIKDKVMNYAVCIAPKALSILQQHGVNLVICSGFVSSEISSFFAFYGIAIIHMVTPSYFNYMSDKILSCTGDTMDGDDDVLPVWFHDLSDVVQSQGSILSSAVTIGGVKFFAALISGKPIIQLCGITRSYERGRNASRDCSMLSQVVIYASNKAVAEMYCRLLYRCIQCIQFNINNTDSGDDIIYMMDNGGSSELKWSVLWREVWNILSGEVVFSDDDTSHSLCMKICNKIRENAPNNRLLLFCKLIDCISVSYEAVSIQLIQNFNRSNFQSSELSLEKAVERANQRVYTTLHDWKAMISNDNPRFSFQAHANSKDFLQAIRSSSKIPVSQFITVFLELLGGLRTVCRIDRDSVLCYRRCK